MINGATVQLGYTLNPDEDYTLEDLLELDLEPFQSQIDKVRISGFKEGTGRKLMWLPEKRHRN